MGIHNTGLQEDLCFLCTYDLYGPVRNAFDDFQGPTPSHLPKKWMLPASKALPVRTELYKSWVHRWFYVQKPTLERPTCAAYLRVHTHMLARDRPRR
jgi:hypothetical protein